jgi:uncharacterized protein YlxW (UPF0749 family)
MTAPVAAPGIATRARTMRGRGIIPVAVVAFAAIAGFLVVGQLQGDRQVPNQLEAENEGDLARILSGLNDEADALQAELAELRVQLNELRRSTESDAAAAQAIDQQIRSLEVLAGTSPVTGPGIIVTITDPSDNLTYDAMIDIVQELRDAGAEAIAINNERVGVATAFAERDGRVTVNGRALSAPYRVFAIGQAATLEGGLKIPGGAVDALTALGKDVKVEIAKQARVDVPALSRPPEFEVARPVGSKP